MTDVTLWITAACFFLILLCTRENPFKAAGTFIQKMVTSKKYAIHFIITFSVLFVNKVEQYVAHQMRYHSDFTASIYNLEGNFISHFQHFFMNPVLTTISSIFYVGIFPSLMITSLLVYTYQRNLKMFYAVCYAIMFNYLVAIPFYLFFSVNEVWSFRPDVHFLVTQVFPTFERDYRPMSALQNCFPSLHTSISVSVAALALKSKNVFWSRFTLLAAAFIMFSVLYLGIHWLTDISAGLVLGLACGRIGYVLSHGKAWGFSLFSAFSKNRNYGK